MSSDTLNLSQVLRSSAEAYRDKPAIVQDDEIITYREFDERVDTLAAHLIKHGVRPGIRVAHLLLNQWEMLVTYHAITRIGAVAVSINFRLTPMEMSYQIEESASKLLVFDASLTDAVAELRGTCTSVDHYIVANGSAELASSSMADILKSRKPDHVEFEHNVAAQDDACIWFTSGTTGRPKGAITTHFSGVWCATASALSLGIDRNSRLLSVAPLFHRGAMEDLHLAATMVGGTHYLTHRFAARDVLERIQRYSITHAFIVPTMARMLLDTPDAAEFDLSSLKHWISASAPLRKDLAEEIRSVFRLRPGVLVNIYGITESLLNSVCPGEELIERGTSVGTPPPGMRVRIIRVDGSLAANGEIGEIVSSGPTVFRTYLNNEEAFRAATFEAEGALWYRSGDMGYRGDDGFFHIVGRSKDMIISGGENVYCAEVESAIATDSRVREVAVIGRSDDKWGERVVAVIVPREGVKLSENDVLEHCQVLARYKRPQEIHFLEELPKNSFGKVQKSEIRSLLQRQA